MVRGVSAPQSGEYFFSVGDDKTVKMWDMDMVTPDVTEPRNTVIAKVCLDFKIIMVCCTTKISYLSIDNANRYNSS